MEGDELYPFDWAELVPRIVHPLRVTIIEALRWFEQPLSSKDLSGLLDESLSIVSYHVGVLRRLGVIQVRSRRQVRGATQTFYFFPKP